MLARPWIEGLRNSTIRNDFQALVTNFMSLHDLFCKEKNKGNFLDIADTCEGIVRMLESPTPPDETAVANAFNNLTTQTRLIQEKKAGQEHQAQFNTLTSEITKAVTKLPIAILQGSKAHHAEAANEAKLAIVVDDAKATNSTRQMRQGLTTVWTAEQMANFINMLKELPEDKTSVVNRMAKKHPYLSGAGALSLAAASGSAAQTGANALFNMLKIGTEYVMSDPRIAVPVVFTLAAMALLGTAYYRSRPAPRPVTLQKHDLAADHKEGQTVDTGPRAPLLRPGSPSSSASVL